MPANPFFNAHHSPIGAFASFTLGLPGGQGGLGLELGKPAGQNVFIGAENADGTFSALPFFGGAEDERARYEVEKKARAKGKPRFGAILRPAPSVEYSGNSTGSGGDQNANY